jgi:hypothetical protein
MARILVISTPVLRPLILSRLALAKAHCILTLLSTMMALLIQNMVGIPTCTQLGLLEATIAKLEKAAKSIATVTMKIQNANFLGFIDNSVCWDIDEVFIFILIICYKTIFNF